jgi:hypothetical protein
LLHAESDFYEVIALLTGIGADDRHQKPPQRVLGFWWPDAGKIAVDDDVKIGLRASFIPLTLTPLKPLGE